jgi:hypothetical protein
VVTNANEALREVLDTEEEVEEKWGKESDIINQIDGLVDAIQRTPSEFETPVLLAARDEILRLRGVLE